MKKTLALALVLVMVISSVCVLFTSADDVETVKESFTQAAETKTVDSSITLWKKASFTSSEAGIDWSYGVLVNEKNEIVGLGRNFSGKTITVPEGNSFIACHFGDGEKTNSHQELNKALQELGQAAGLYTIPENATKDQINAAMAAISGEVKDVSSAGWHLVIDEDDGDFGSFTLYKGAAPSTEEPSEDTSSAEPVEVKEEIVVDGKLEDTGWTKAEWKTINTETGTQQVQPKDNPEKVALGDLEYQFAVRADDENIYVAVKVNALPNNCKEADKMDDKVSSGTHFRFYFTPDTDVTAYGKDGAMAVLDTLLDILVENDGTLGIYKSKEPTTDATAVMTKTETDSVYEISIKKSLFNIGDVFRMATSYSDCHFGSENAGYNVLNDHKYDVASEGGADTPWATNAHYTTYKVAELALGTYTEEPEPEKPDPAEELKKELAEKVTPVENADFKVDLTSKLEKNDAGKLVYTVTLKVKDIKEGVHMQSFTAALHYDPEVLKLTTEVNPNNSLKCEVKVPGSTWENLVKVEPDVDGKPTGIISVEYTCTEPPFDEVSADNFELCFTFEVLTDAKAVGVYVDSEDAKSTYMPNDADNSDITNYKGEGSYTVDSYAEPVEESSSSSEASSSTSTTPSKPGDAGILIFAVLGIVAIAGAVTVIKVRR